MLKQGVALAMDEQHAALPFLMFSCSPYYYAPPFRTESYISTTRTHAQLCSTCSLLHCQLRIHLQFSVLKPKNWTSWAIVITHGFGRHGLLAVGGRARYGYVWRQLWHGATG